MKNFLDRKKSTEQYCIFIARLKETNSAEAIWSRIVLAMITNQGSYLQAVHIKD